MNLSDYIGPMKPYKRQKKMRVYILNMETGKTSSIVVYHDLEAVLAVHKLQAPFKFLCVDSELYIERGQAPEGEPA